MIKIGRKILGAIISIINWPEIFNGILFFLVGAAFVRHYGYQINWQLLLNLCLWLLFYKSALYCLTALLSGDIDKREGLREIIVENKGEMRVLVYKYFWIVVIMFLAVSFLPLSQILGNHGLNGLTLAIITLIYLSDLAFLITNFQNILAGIIEVKYAFVTAFLLPALFFSLTRDYLKASMILVTFPLFLQLVAWQMVNNLDNTLRKESIPLTSMILRIGIADSLTAAAALALLGTLTVFLDIKLVDILFKAAIVPLGIITAWFILRSGRNQNAFWQRALFFTRLLPLVTAFSIIYSLWMN